MLSNISVKELNLHSKKKVFWCMGCGRRFHEMIELYQEEPFIERIVGLIDNNKNLWGIEKQVGNHVVQISGIKKLKEKGSKKIVLILTIDHYREIYDSIKSILRERNISCYVYPKYYFKSTRMLVSFVKYLPLERSMVFYAGKEPHENADEIVNYLKEEYQGQPYRIYYLDDPNDEREKNVSHINKWALKKKTSFVEILKYCFTIGTSEYLFYENEPLDKMRTDQKLIFLNHGTIPLKDVSDVLRQPDAVDFSICPSEGCADIYEKQYGIKREKQVYLMPPRVNKMLRCKEKMHEFAGKDNLQTILWLPTFRRLEGTERIDSVEENPIALLSQNPEAINEMLKNNDQLLIVKKHPREKTVIEEFDYCSNIKVITEQEMKEKETSLQELLKGADALLTDYSGIAFEYMLLNRPIGYVISDIDQYQRGFSVSNPLLYMPGMLIKNMDALRKFLWNVKEKKDDYFEKRRELTNRIFQNKTNENGCRLLVDFADSIDISKR